MNKNVLIAVVGAILLLGGVVVWHLTGHGGVDHADTDHGAHGHVSTASGHDDHHGHDDHASGANELKLDDGEKWATDTHLRAGMSKIHDRAKPAYTAFQKGSLSASESEEIATLIRGEVNTLIEKCNLEPEADAMLHIVIGDMMAAASAMEKDPSSDEGVPKLVGALQAYAEHFEHPDF